MGKPQSPEGLKPKTSDRLDGTPSIYFFYKTLWPGCDFYRRWVAVKANLEPVISSFFLHPSFCSKSSHPSLGASSDSFYAY